MGLDMYLYARRYVPGYDFYGAEQVARFQAILDAAEYPLGPGPSPSATVSVTAAYWRKANAIHGWFVKHVQNGVDDCNEYEVRHAQLAELLIAATRALTYYDAGNPGAAAELLPPESGFFFGSTALDEGYRQDLADTVAQLTALQALGERWSFAYQSSW